ncbi:unnamed protein product [Peniophora sp. CBMAI 1063]|nr:unnamed protein product [Peniophora sp. CBMAI 1063]
MTPPPTGFLGLPNELLSVIALLLDHRDIVHLSMVCRRIQNVYRASKELQYIVDLGRLGYVDGPPQCPLSISERHELLLSRRRAWDHAMPHLTAAHPSADQSYTLDLAGNVYVHYAVSRNPQLVIHYLPSRACEATTIEVPELDVLLDSLAIDPSQDLLAFVEGHIDPDEPLTEEGLFGTDLHGRIAVHLRSLSSPDAAAHGQAFVPILRTDCTYAFLAGSAIHIAGSSLALFSAYPDSFLMIWNWNSGEQLFYMDFEHFDYAHLQCHGFTYLSMSAFSLTQTDPSMASTLLIPFDPTGQTKGAPKDMIQTCTRLLFPRPYIRQNRILYITAGTSSLGRPEPRRQAFVPSPASRLHSFFIKIVHHEDHEAGSVQMDTVLAVIVKTSTLLSWISSGAQPGRRVAWSEWAPGNVRIVEQGETSHLSDVAFSGSRVTFGVQYSRTHENPEGPVAHYILDFNTAQRSVTSDYAERTFNDDHSVAVARRLIGSEETAISMGLKPESGSFDWTQETVTRQLPCLCTGLKDSIFGEEDDVLLDDMYIMKSVYTLDLNEEHDPTTIYVF